MLVLGELKSATLEVLATNPSANTTARIWYNSTDQKFYLDDASVKRALLRNDQRLVIGNNGTAASNVRINRAGAGKIQLVIGSDVTAEGSLSTTLAEVGQRLENFTTGTLPAFGNIGRVVFNTTTGSIQMDTGSAWIDNALGYTSIDGQTGLTAPDIADELAIADVSATALKKIRLDDYFKVINGLTEDTSPARASDFVVTYDTSAGTAKKVKPSNLSPFSESFESSEQAISINANISVSHGLTGAPTLWQVVLRNKTAEFSYVAGDEVIRFYSTSGNVGASDWVNSTTIGVKLGGLPQVSSRTANVDGQITAANWRIVFRAWR